MRGVGGHIATMQRAYELWSHGDLAGLIEMYDPEFEMDNTRFEGWVGKEVYRGYAGLAEFFEEWRGAWSEYRVTPKDVREKGDKVVAIAQQVARGRGSHVPVDMHDVGMILTFRGGKILRQQNFSDASEAVREAGFADDS